MVETAVRLGAKLIKFLTQLFLGLNVFVSIVCVELMSAIPLNVRPHRDNMTLDATRPFVCGVEQHLSDSARADTFVDNQSANLGNGFHFDSPEDVQPDPARNLAGGKLGHKHGVLVRVLHLAKPHANFF
jgi:hypothetical protein